MNDQNQHSTSLSALLLELQTIMDMHATKYKCYTNVLQLLEPSNCP